MFEFLDILFGEVIGILIIFLRDLGEDQRIGRNPGHHHTKQSKQGKQYQILPTAATAGAARTPSRR